MWLRKQNITNNKEVLWKVIDLVIFWEVHLEGKAFFNLKNEIDEKYSVPFKHNVQLKMLIRSIKGHQTQLFF